MEEIKDTDFSRDYGAFTLILQQVCHPVSSPDERSLKKSFAHLEKVLTRDKVRDMFMGHSERIIEQFLKRRTGVLSDNSKVRHMAKNVLILFSWAGQMESLLPEMVPIFDYKPIQMLNKMEGLLHQDFDRISHYDLMFYSEMSKDLLKLFASRDAITERQALR